MAEGEGLSLVVKDKPDFTAGEGDVDRALGPEPVRDLKALHRDLAGLREQKVDGPGVTGYLEGYAERDLVRAQSVQVRNREPSENLARRLE